MFLLCGPAGVSARGLPPGHTKDPAPAAPKSTTSTGAAMVVADPHASHGSRPGAANAEKKVRPDQQAQPPGQQGLAPTKQKGAVAPAKQKGAVSGRGPAKQKGAVSGPEPAKQNAAAEPAKQKSAAKPAVPVTKEIAFASSAAPIAVAVQPAPTPVRRLDSPPAQQPGPAAPPAGRRGARPATSLPRSGAPAQAGRVPARLRTRLHGAPFGPLTRPPLSAPAREGRPVSPAGGRERSPALVTEVLQVVPPLLGGILVAVLGLALLLASGSVVAELQSRRLRRQRELLRADVGLLQSALLPSLTGRIGPVVASAAYRPADGPAAGGDFYDVFSLGDRRVGLIVGDVAGHGRDALPRTALVRYTMRAYLEAGLPPRASVQMAAPLLARELDGSGVTVALAVYDDASRLLTYACAGHPPPVIAGLDRRPVTACSSPAVGLGLPTGNRQTTLALPQPATVCFYTDGVTDASSQDVPFGDARLATMVSRMGATPDAQALVDGVASATDRQPDDMAACLLRVGSSQSAVAEMTLEELEVDAASLRQGDRLERFLAACDVSPSEFGWTRERAEHVVGVHGRALLAIRRTDGDVSVEVSTSRVRVLDPLRASGLAAAV